MSAYNVNDESRIHDALTAFALVMTYPTNNNMHTDNPYAGDIFVSNSYYPTGGYLTSFSYRQCILAN